MLRRANVERPCFWMVVAAASTTRRAGTTGDAVTAMALMAAVAVAVVVALAVALRAAGSASALTLAGRCILDLLESPAPPGSGEVSADPDTLEVFAAMASTLGGGGANGLSSGFFDPLMALLELTLVLLPPPLVALLRPALSVALTVAAVLLRSALSEARLLAVLLRPLLVRR